MSFNAMPCGSTGSFELDGKPYRPKNPMHALDQGIALVPEDRKKEGAVLGLSIRDNLSLSSLQRHTARQDHFLLVPAGELAHLLLGVNHFDLQRLPVGPLLTWRYFVSPRKEDALIEAYRQELQIKMVNAEQPPLCGA